MRTKYYSRIASDRKEYHCVTRLAVDSTTPTISSTPFNLNSTQSNLAAGFMTLNHTWAGTAAQSLFHNNVIEVELPYYANYRFRPARQIRIQQTPVPDVNVNKSYHRYQKTSANEQNYIMAFVSVAEDFNLNFFLGAPVMFRYSDPNPIV